MRTLPRGWCLLALAPLLFVAGPATAAKELALRVFSIELPGAPVTVLPTDIDGDGVGDLLIVVAYSEWTQLVTEESVEMTQVDGLVEMMTIVPALNDRRELLAFRGLPAGGFETFGEALALDLSILSITTGPRDSPVVALTDAGVSALRFEETEDGPALSFEPLLERRSVLSYTGVLLPELELFWDLNGDGAKDLLLPGRRTFEIFLWTPNGFGPDPEALIHVPRRPNQRDRRRFYPIPKVADVTGDGLADLVFRIDNDWEEFWVARNPGGGRFEPLLKKKVDFGPEEDRLEPVYFGDLNGDGRGQYVAQEQTDKEDVGWRKSMQQAKVPHFRYHFYDTTADLGRQTKARVEHETIGYGFGAGEIDEEGDIPIPFGLQDLDGDRRLDLITVTLDFSVLQAFRILATKSISIGMDFHVSCQQADGTFRVVQGLDLSGKFKLRLDDLRVGRLSQFAGDFDGDGRADFVQIGRGRDVSIHRGREGCSYAPAPDLKLRLRQEPKNLALVKVRDLDGDGLADLMVVHPQADSSDGASSPVRLDLYLSRGGG